MPKLTQEQYQQKFLSDSKGISSEMFKAIAGIGYAGYLAGHLDGMYDTQKALRQAK